jgi:hypothetical protein
MGIRSDLDEIRGLWNRGSWLVRGFAILLFVLALGPVASLSDTIFQFRGFIRDGIEFYETWIRDPFRETLYLVFGIKLGTLWSSESGNMSDESSISVMAVQGGQESELMLQIVVLQFPWSHGQ